MRGLYSHGDWVTVEVGNSTLPITKERYVELQTLPSHDRLPSSQQYFSDEIIDRLRAQQKTTP